MRTPLAWACLLVLAAGTQADAGANGRCRPSQIHLALTGNPTEMRVSWRTTHSGCPSRVHYGSEEAVVTAAADASLAWGDAAGHFADAPGAPALPVAAAAGEGQDGECHLLPPAGVQEGALASVTCLSDVVETSYDPDDMCAAPARDYNYDKQHFQSAVMRNLDPGGTYYYRLHGDRNIYSFTAPPASQQSLAGSAAAADGTASDEQSPEFKFLVYGDMGESEHASAKSPGASATAHWLEKEVRQGNAQLVLHVGDVAYANGKEEVWSTFMTLIEPAAARAPYMVTVGNHEYCYEAPHKGLDQPDPSGETEPYDPSWGNYGNDSGGECGVPISRRFIMPQSAQQHGHHQAAPAPPSPPACPPSANCTYQGLAADDMVAAMGSGDASSSSSNSTQGGAAAGDSNPAADKDPPSNAPFWYSFSYGPVAFIALSSEHDLSKDGRQYTWLEAALKAVDRCATPWLVVLMHRPMYVVLPHKANREVAEHLRSRIEHLLDRYQVDLVFSGHVHSYARTCNVYDEKCKDSRDGGMRHVTLGCAGHKLSFIEKNQEQWLEAAEMEFGYGRVTVGRGGRGLRFEFVATGDGTVHDVMELREPRSWDECSGLRGDGKSGIAADSSSSSIGSNGGSNGGSSAFAAS